MKTSHNLSDAYDPMGDMLAREAMQCHAHGCDGATSARPRLSSRVRKRLLNTPLTVLLMQQVATDAAAAQRSGCFSAWAGA